MNREVILIKIKHTKKRASFLFNDGEFRPRKEKSIRDFSRRVKHPNRSLDKMYEYL